MPPPIGPQPAAENIVRNALGPVSVLQSAIDWLKDVDDVTCVQRTPGTIWVSYQNNFVCALQPTYRTQLGDCVMIKDNQDRLLAEFNTPEQVVQEVCNLMGVEVPNAPEEQLGADMLSALHRRLLRLERRAYR